MKTVDRVLVIVAILVGVGVGLNQLRTVRALNAAQVSLDSIEKSNREVAEMRNEQYRQITDMLGDVIASDKNIALAIVDADIRHFENRQYGLVGGSYTDWVLPTLQNARVKGASMSEVNKRLDRILGLAKEGRYFSSILEEAARAGNLEKEIQGSREWLAKITPAD